MKKNSIVCAVLLAVILFINCSRNDGPLKVNSPDEGQGISGSLFSRNGSSLKFTPVNIRKKNYLADTSESILAKKTIQTFSVTTDGNGNFSFDSILEPDLYVIDAKSGNEAVLIDSIRVLEKTTRIALGADTLRPAGAIKGIVGLSKGGSPEHAFVLAFGIDRFTEVNPDGSFLFTGLAEGIYTLRIVSGSGDYGSLDTDAIAVVSAETTDVHMLTLPYRGVPVPQNLILSYDTLSQSVILKWNSVDTAILQEYKVYRRNVDSNGVFIPLRDNLQLQDTFYIDSIAMQNFTYEFRVSAINKNKKEGVKSSAAQVTISTRFIIDTIYKIPYGTMGGSVTDIQDIALGPGNDIFVSSGDYHDSRIVVFNSAMRYVLQFRKSGALYPLQLTIDNNNVVVYNHTTKDPVSIFSPAGVLVDTFDAQRDYNDIDAKQSLIALADNNGVYLYSLDGTLKKAFNFHEEAGKQVAKIKVVNSNEILVAFNSWPSAAVAAYDFSGVKLSEFSLPAHDGGIITDIACDSVSQSVFVAMTFYKDQRLNEGAVFVYDKNLNETANYYLTDACNMPLSLAMQEEGLLIAKRNEIVKLKLLQ